MIDRLLAEICTKVILSAQKELESGYDDQILNVQNLCRRILAGDEFWNENSNASLAQSNGVKLNPGLVTGQPFRTRK